MYRYLFFVHESDNNLEQLAHIEYWLDDAEDSLFTMSVDSAELTIVMDISHLQTDATHYFNVRGINRDGEQSLSERLEFFYPSDSLVMDSLPTPEIVRNEDGMIAITVPMDSVSIYYTTDGSEPTAASTLYSEPFLPTQNCTIKAIAMREGFLSSEVTTFEVDWFKVAAVVFEQNGILVTLSTPTEGATIYYSTDGSEPSIPYEGVLTMAGDCTIKAFAVKDGYTQSATTSYEFHANGVTVATPVIASNGNRIGMSTTTEQAVIYYTLDGSEPTAESAVYTDSITVTQNCTIKAIAMRENYYPSQVTTFEVDWFKVADVVFEQNGILVTLSTTTEGATIYYSLDDSEPSIPYEGVLTMTGDCTIKAFAVKDGYTQSATTSYEFHANGVTVATPVIVRHDNKIGISTATDGATIHYTLDGSEPTAESAVYTDSITVTQNCTIKAIALRENYYPSQVTTFEVDWFTVSEPVFALDGYRLTMSCSTAGASIYYNTEGQEPSVMDALYASPIDLTEDCIVKAVAIKNGFNNSEVTTYQFRKADATVSSPVIAVDGNRLTMTTATEGATIYYTLDGSEPTAASTVYTDSMTVDQNCTIKAIALRENWFASEIATFEVDWFITAPPVIALSFDGRAVTMTSEAGASIYYTLDGTEPTTASLRYEDEPIALSSLCTVKAIATAEGRESSEVMTLIVNSLFDGITARIGVGGTIEEAFQWCGGIAQADGLAAIVWSRDDDFPADAAASIRNPNLLLYVNDYTLALGVGIRNVVSNGLAQRITLTDNIQADGSYGPANFYAPQPFRVQNEISYTHKYTQTTKPNECRGWETIALPFTVQAVTHETNGSCVPFASYVAGMKPFWLCRLTEQGFVDADSIRANEPYIISMPASEEYSPYYRLGGTVTFSAREVSVPATEPRVSTRGGASFVPCFQTTEASQSIYALNVGEERSGYAEGSLFDRNYRDVRPFEAYRTTTQAGVRSMPIADELGGATGIDNRVEIKDKRYSYYNLQGVPVKVPGKGVYIRNGKKVVRSAK